MWKTNKIADRLNEKLNARSNKKKLHQQALDNPHNTKLRRDPGVPNLSHLQSAIDRRANTQNRIESERKQKREEKFNKLRAAQQENVKSKEEKNADVEVAKRRWYFKELKKVIDSSDIILQILDARDPQGCRSAELEQQIISKMQSDGNHSKRIILVLNKIDLVPHEVVLKWVKYLRREYPCIAFKSSTQQQRGNLQQSKYDSKNIDSDLLQRSASVGASELLQLLKNYSRSLNIKKHITVGIIGYPNTGKSSLINSLKRSRAVAVGSTPGLTKTLQLVKLDKTISLIDSPGVMFSGGYNDEDLLLRNCLRVEQLEDPILAAYGIVKRCTEEQLMKSYDIDHFDDADQFLSHVANKRGKLGKGGIPDLKMAARLVIKDWNDGKIQFYSLPPVVNDIQSSEVVSSWAKEFNIESLLNSGDKVRVEHLDEKNNSIEMEEEYKIGEKEIINEEIETEVIEKEYVPKPKTSDMNDATSIVDETLNNVNVAPVKKITATDANNFQINKQLKLQQKREKKLKNLNNEMNDENNINEESNDIIED